LSAFAGWFDATFSPTPTLSQKDVLSSTNLATTGSFLPTRFKRRRCELQHDRAITEHLNASCAAPMPASTAPTQSRHRSPHSSEPQPPCAPSLPRRLAPVIVWVVEPGTPSAVAMKSCRAARLGAEALNRVQAGDPRPHGPDDSPASKECAKAHRPLANSG
jgi:hypothetical protein